MKVILKENIDDLGIMGSVVSVANGYGRNYLIPKDLAVEANPKNIKRFEHEKKIILKKAENVKNTADKLAVKISSIKLIIEVNAGEDDKLFGSVTTRDIAEAISKQGVEVDKRKIVIPDEQIKRLGTYDVLVKVHPEVTAKVSLEVCPARKEE
ncbi:MAG TPA: 50S ribosomal protein L9 [Nitrospirae bacterium]|nr:50S ribosomal protein L9 [bacterium BMS3Abin10]GBE38232.1 50S ribosomal protein L9 [bacterium BMS3Bbin08]HDH01455.1 50S ribosomal protein L9 [Nitrospirota bacterium]HDH51342.1 50S ribosomal protein L9 [Nitrospirota bacterium]HDK41364.1 50S ribosomal protein L9 [Nitrospirota bacterium]